MKQASKHAVDIVVNVTDGYRTHGFTVAIDEKGLLASRPIAYY